MYTVLLIAVVAFFSLVGCAETPKYSGFLKDYPSFKPGKEGVDMVYIKEGTNFKNYNKIMMDQVVFYFKEDTDYKGINPEEIKELTEAFKKAFVDALNDAYPFTETPEQDVMRVRIAITDVEPSSPTVGTMTTIIPVGLAVSVIKKGATGEYTGIGSASMEAEFLDSISNERIGAVVDKDPGGKLDLGKLTPAKEAFKFWAKRLKAFLDDAHGVK